jgi:hypothetical protein
MKTLHRTRLVLCIDNTGYPASLEPRKLYQVLPDADAKGHGQLRVVDESGEDYLFPASLFVTGVRLPWKKVGARRTLFSKVARMVKARRGRSRTKSHARSR